MGRRILLAVPALAMPLLLWTGFTVWQERHDTRLIACILRIQSSPASVHSVECRSWSLTDVLTTCAFAISPEDFPALPTGWPFKESATDALGRPVSADGWLLSAHSPVATTAHALPAEPKLGTNFKVAKVYAVRPAEFQHGGDILLATNEPRTQVLLSLYEE